MKYNDDELAVPLDRTPQVLNFEDECVRVGMGLAQMARSRLA